MEEEQLVPTKANIWSKLVVIFILAVFAAFIIFQWLPAIGLDKNFPFKLGLDLQGGTHLVYEGNLADIAPSDRDDAMDSVRDVIERRVNAFGVAEPLVQVAGENRLIVELPGIQNIDEAIEQIGLTPFLEFRVPNPDYQPSGVANPEQEIAEAFLASGLSGKNLERSDIVFDPQTNRPQITLQFNKEGADIFAELTRRYIGQQIAIFLDGKIISSPVVNQQINSGQAVITGSFTIDEAKELAQRLNAGALPVPITLVQQQNVGASLGHESVQKSVLAGFVGLLAVAVFMSVYYKAPGAVAVLALVIYTFLNLAVYKLIPVTLSLAGIAGFLLSVGMAVDANILIFERTREELRRGFALDKAMHEGFRRAWSAIRDSNVSSLITVFILGFFGTSIIRGFAITLGIGIILSMFTAITVTRTFLHALFVHNLIRSPKFFGVKHAEDN
jgi:protein-export membrane protein SecD